MASVDSSGSKTGVSQHTSQWLPTLASGPRLPTLASGPRPPTAAHAVGHTSQYHRTSTPLPTLGQGRWLPIFSQKMLPPIYSASGPRAARHTNQWATPPTLLIPVIRLPTTVVAAAHDQPVGRRAAHTRPVGHGHPHSTSGPRRPHYPPVAAHTSQWATLPTLNQYTAAHTQPWVTPTPASGGRSHQPVAPLRPTSPPSGHGHHDPPVAAHTSQWATAAQHTQPVATAAHTIQWAAHTSQWLPTLSQWATAAHTSQWPLPTPASNTVAHTSQWTAAHTAAHTSHQWPRPPTRLPITRQWPRLPIQPVGHAARLSASGCPHQPVATAAHTNQWAMAAHTSQWPRLPTSQWPRLPTLVPTPASGHGCPHLFQWPPTPASGPRLLTLASGPLGCPHLSQWPRLPTLASGPRPPDTLPTLSHQCGPQWLPTAAHIQPVGHGRLSSARYTAAHTGCPLSASGPRAAHTRASGPRLPHLATSARPASGPRLPTHSTSGPTPTSRATPPIDQPVGHGRPQLVPQPPTGASGCPH
ncbi:sialidase-like [Alosa alosa]|uniref:sialidase-like n=1 Tax=Alosa alosa TaxID=278164 RepID=UPI00201513AF|nr:sialidase-like [Alosa alosa]